MHYFYHCAKYSYLLHWGRWWWDASLTWNGNIQWQRAECFWCTFSLSLVWAGQGFKLVTFQPWLAASKPGADTTVVRLCFDPAGPITPSWIKQNLPSIPGYLWHFCPTVLLIVWSRYWMFSSFDCGSTFLVITLYHKDNTLKFLGLLSLS